MKIGRRSDKNKVMELVYKMQNGKVSALVRLKKVSVPVKDIASQLWCEKQMELYELGGFYNTPAMIKGAAIHSSIQEKVFKKLPVEPVTYPDRLYKWAYENYTSLINLKKDGYCREIRMYGSINGFRVAGQLDEIRIIDNKTIIVEDKTINSNNGNNNVSLRVDADKMQLAIYKLLLDDIISGGYTYENFSNSNGILQMVMSSEFIKGLNSIGVKTEMQRLDTIHKLMFEELKKLPEISNVLKLRYLDRKNSSIITEMDIVYEKAVLEQYLVDAMKYWSGDREARPVSKENNWRCNMCKFYGKECKAWWKE